MMENKTNQTEHNVMNQTVDSAALAGAAIAAALSVFGTPGPYTPLNGVVGLTVLIILFTYELRRYRTPWQNLAFGSVCALVSLLILGFAAEFCKADWGLAYWIPLEERQPPKSEVNYWFLLIWWVFLTGVFSVIGYRCGGNRLSPTEVKSNHKE